MREHVYVKFAAALERIQAEKTAAVRKETVQMKLAEALQQRQLEKQAAGRLALLKVLSRLSPKVNATSWGKYDPRRLFTTTRTTPIKATNSASVAASQAVPAGAGSESGGRLPFADLPQNAERTVTRLSPGKILASLGIGGGAAALGKSTTDSSSVPAIPASKNTGTLSSLWERLAANPKMVAALAGAGLLTAGGIGYAVASSGDKKKPSEDY